MYTHFEQINPLCCGAACMQMVYHHLGMDIPQADIWNAIKRSSEFTGEECCPEKMQQHFHAHGFSALYALDTIDLDLFFTWVERHNLIAIVNYAVSSINNHFVVYERTEADGIIVQDPSSKTPDTFLPYTKLAGMQVMLISPGSYNAQCPTCNSIFPSNPIASWTYARHVARCAYCQQELIYTYMR